ncbi:MAG TPA: hypothetical protein VK563_01060 [Puia sp.]|nr:hypothetical protein [Puia sp.]
MKKIKKKSNFWDRPLAVTVRDDLNKLKGTIPTPDFIEEGLKRLKKIGWPPQINR